MARTKPTYTPSPRVWDAFQVATRLGRSEGWFRENRHKLEAKGFPARNDLLSGWDADAIDLWMDVQSGIGQTTSKDAFETMEGIYD